MSDAITTQAGVAMGSWDGTDVKVLQKELTRIRQELKNAGSADKIVAAEMPHRTQLPEDLQSFTAYPIWGFDKQEKLPVWRKSQPYRICCRCSAVFNGRTPLIISLNHQ